MTAVAIASRRSADETPEESFPQPELRLVIQAEERHGSHRVPKLCHQCGEPKTLRLPVPWGRGFLEIRSPAGAHFCPLCRRSRERAEAERLLCQRCRVRPKLSGQGRRLCGECEPVGYDPRRPWARCKKCGERNPKRGKGHRHCIECEDLVHWQTVTRQRARRASRRLPCRNCGGLKPAGRARSLCDRCRNQRSAYRHENSYEGRVRPCSYCLELKPMAFRAKQCDDCRRESKEIERRRRRAYYERLKREQPERLRAQWARWQEQKQKRVRQQCTGDPTLPALPLVRAVDHVAAREFPDYDGARTGVTIICERAGIAPRTLYRWREERPRAQLSLVEAFLDAMDLLWWEVWEEPVAPARRGAARDVVAYLQQAEEYLLAEELFSGEPRRRGSVRYRL